MFRRLFGDRLPPGFSGQLAEDEHVLAVAPIVDGGYLTVTQLGIWVSEEAATRRVGWHLIGKAAWSDGVLTLTECEEIGQAGQASLLRNLAPVSYRLQRAGKIPLLVRQRVDGSIRARHRQELDAGGMWFVQRKIPGVDGVILQVLADPTVDPDAVATLAARASEKLHSAHQPG